MPKADDPILSTDLAGLKLVNPVVLAAGTCGTLDEMADVLDLAGVGALTTKSITRAPRDGNATWRVVPAPAGMLNAIGLANPGVERFAGSIAPRAGELACPVFGSIAGFSVEDYVGVAAAMDDAPGIVAAELNVSCPNVHGGTEFGADPEALADLVRAVRPVLASTRLIVKLSPVVIGTPHSIVRLAEAAVDHGADALTLANTVPAMAIDVRTRRPLLANVTGGLSGPAVHAVAVKLVHDVYRGVARDAGVPIIGLGGVAGWRSAAEFILAGATAVGVGTALFAGPRTPVRIARGLARWARAQRVSGIGELIGAVDTSPSQREATA